MAVHLNVSLGKVHGWYRFVDFFVVTVRWEGYPNCLTKFRNLINGNRNGSLLKRFARQNPRMVLIRGFFCRNS